MIRTLAIIFGAGLVVSTAALSAAFFIAGPQNVINGAWTYGPHGWGDVERHHPRYGAAGGAPQASREIAWTGGEALTVEVDADLTYTQASGPARITVAGSQDAVADVEIVDGVIRYAHRDDRDERLTITVSAPAVAHFTLEGDGRLDIRNYNQESLALNLEGGAGVTATGTAKTLKLVIAGSADADLGALKTDAAEVEIDGSGTAKLAPANQGRVDIAGSGEVRLLTDPPKLATHISGSGQVIHGAKTDSGE